MKITAFIFEFHTRNFVHHGLIDNNITLVQTMAWHGEGDKPSAKPAMTQFINT